MTNRKTKLSGSRTDATRCRVIEAAERLLRSGSADFSMRELAAEAGVSFATPFNHFGNKAAIMHALSAQRIGAMAERYDRAKPEGDAAARVLAAIDIAAAVMLAEPKVNRAVMATLGAAVAEPGRVHAQSRALWARAIGPGDGFATDLVDLGCSALPDQLAVAFRGVLSFWTASEIADTELAARARAAAGALMLGFIEPERRGTILAALHDCSDRAEATARVATSPAP